MLKINKTTCIQLCIALLLLSLTLYPHPSVSAQTECPAASVSLSSDYRFAIGSVDLPAGAKVPLTWRVNAEPISTGKMSGDLLLAFDDSTTGSQTQAAVIESNVGFVPGRRGQALDLHTEGKLTYPVKGLLPLQEGSIDFWIAPLKDGSDPIYNQGSHVLLGYAAPNADTFEIAVAPDSGVVYAGGTVNKKWESAYSDLASTRSWKAGDWHHILFSYSVSGNFMNFYLDGRLVASTNEGHYKAPSANGKYFSVGSGLNSQPAGFLIDDLRISNQIPANAEVASRALNNTSATAYEAWLSLDNVHPNDKVELWVNYAGHECGSNPLKYPGIPITDPQPPSTLLPAGSTQLDLTVTTSQPTYCRYALGEDKPYEQMIAFQQTGTATHTTTVSSLRSDPLKVNKLFVRCASHPDYVLPLLYRSLAKTNPSYPRTGNLWGAGEFLTKGINHLAGIDLWLGADLLSPDQIAQLRELNPDVLVLTSINAVENTGLPDDYYLKDTRGRRIEVWPGSYRLNLTKPEVAEYQARYAYESLLHSGMLADGVFFDNVMTTQSWQNKDIFGNPVLIDADENGRVDDPAKLDAAWKAGVFHELRTFRLLAPYAVISGHSMDIFEPGIATIFNGISLGFVTADVLESERSFSQLWETYQAWLTQAVSPAHVMFESSPRDQIAYGYDYDPLSKVPPSTLEFARSYYPDIRFGLAFTLMGDGFFAHEFGDTYHGNDWWYDELDFDLGYPLGPALEVPISAVTPVYLLKNAGFEAGQGEPWKFFVSEKDGCLATASFDTAGAPEGSRAEKIEIEKTSGTDWHIQLAQDNLIVELGKTYQLAFRAKADKPRSITLNLQKGVKDFANYGLLRGVNLDTEWQQYSFRFESLADAQDASLQFLVGADTGTVWLDDVSFSQVSPFILQREFTNGLVLLNPTHEKQLVQVGSGWRRLTGSQAPMVEYILDDTAPSFATTGVWKVKTVDSGEWKASGPFYHAWNTQLHFNQSFNAEATWVLDIPMEDIYTISAWWPAAPDAFRWNRKVRFEVLAGGAVVATLEVDQHTSGDTWNPIASVKLKPSDNATVRLVCPSLAPCIADALHISSASRYNDGSPAAQVLLGPMDGILLQRQETNTP